MTNHRNSSHWNPDSPNGTPDVYQETGGDGMALPHDAASDQECLRVLQKLSRAWEYSLDCDRSRWDFAVELADLSQDGISHETLRWMIGKGLVEHAMESDNHHGIGRSFESPGGFTFNERSCFVITATGLESQQKGSSTVIQNRNRPASGSLPVWDDQRHELRLGGILVKRFKWRAANQEAVLAAFQEEGWPPRIDDPLPPVAETDPKRRLSDAIKCLNRKQKNPLLRFSGDGTGEGILWDLVPPASSDSHAPPLAQDESPAESCPAAH